MDTKGRLHEKTSTKRSPKKALEFLQSNTHFQASEKEIIKHCCKVMRRKLKFYKQNLITVLANFITFSDNKVMLESLEHA